MGKLFISYAREDRPFVTNLAKELTARGHEVWWDRELRGGSDYRTRIQQAIDESDLAIVVWSARSQLSDFVLDESERARSRGKLLPVSIDDASPPLGFGSLHTIDLGSWSGTHTDPVLASLDREIDERLAGGSRKPPRRPPIRLLGKGLVLSALAALAFGSAQGGVLALGTLAEGVGSTASEIARFATEHAAIAFLLTLPVAAFACVRAHGLGLSRFGAVARPFFGALAIGFFVALVIGATALANGAGGDLAPRARAAELGGIVLLSTLTAAAILGVARLIARLIRGRAA